MVPDFTWKFQTFNKIYMHRLKSSLKEIKTYKQQSVIQIYQTMKEQLF